MDNPATEPTPRPRKAKGNGGNGASPIDGAAFDGSVFDDLTKLRLDDAASLTGTVEHLAHVPVRRPLKTEFFRVNNDPELALVASVFEDREERETYFVLPQARQFLIGQLKPVMLLLCINRQSVLYLWPLALPDDGGRISAWGETARQAAELAKHEWINLRPDMHLGAYRIKQAEGALPDPVWPDKPFNELLKIGFKGRIIGDAEHPVVRRLRGLT